MNADTRFHSFLGPEIERFLAHKRSLRRRYDVEEKTLALLDTYLSKLKIGSLAELTPALVDEFLLSRPRSRPRSYNHLRCTVGRLFSYLVDHGGLSQTPLRSPARRARYQRTPFIFDKAAAKRLLALAKTLPSKGGTIERGSTYFVLLAVLYGLGLRVGEACRLHLGDVDLERRLLMIRETKFYKSRLVPFGPKLGALLAEHLRQRQNALAGTAAGDQPLFCLRGAGQSTPGPSVKPFTPWSQTWIWRSRPVVHLRACTIFGMPLPSAHSHDGTGSASTPRPSFLRCRLSWGTSTSVPRRFI